MKLFVSVKRSNCADKECTELFSYQKKLWKKSWARQSVKILNCQYQNRREYYILHIFLSKKESHVYALKDQFIISYLLISAMSHRIAMHVQEVSMKN